MEKEPQRLLLDLKMPNGKKLRDCTAGEMRAMGKLLTSLGAGCNPDDVIGELIRAMSRDHK